MLAEKLADENALDTKIICDNIIWNAGSLHIYERHFKFLDDMISKEQ
jgi:thymidylate synthase